VSALFGQRFGIYLFASRSGIRENFLLFFPVISRVSLVDRPRGGQELIVTTDCVTVVLRSLDPIDTVGLTYLVEYAQPGVAGGIG
jgi:hypothetical protein